MTKKRDSWRVTKRSAAPSGLDIMCGSVRIATVSAANPQAERNAHLIAAAPRLQSALHLLISAVNTRDGIACGNDLALLMQANSVLEETIGVAREALALADGHHG